MSNSKPNGFNMRLDVISKNHLFKGIIKIIPIFILTLALAYEAQGSPIQGNNYTNKNVGLSFSIPEGWQFISLDDAFKYVAQQYPTNKKAELEKEKEYFVKLKSSTKMEPVFVTKYPEPYSGFNPTFQIYLAPYDLNNNDLLLEFMRIYLDDQIKKGDALQVIFAPALAYFAGRKAGYAEVTGVDSGVKIKFTSRLWVVPWGEMAFIVAVFKPIKKDAIIEGEFSKLLISTRIWE